MTVKGADKMNRTIARFLHMRASLPKIGNVLKWLKKNIVLCIAFSLAVATSLIVPPDAEYANYFDWKTLACLFSVLAVVCALKNIRFFTILAHRIVSLTGNLRIAVIALIYITFIGSMLIANDMALLTFLPLGYFVLHATDNERYMAPVFILQNIAANLGGMLTPFGNPQNLYIYSYFNIPTGEFMSIMLPAFLLAITMITICCLFFPGCAIELTDKTERKLPIKRTSFYLVLFALSIIMVFRLIPYWIGLIVIAVCIGVADRKALKAVDYPLLLTFFCFFIFAGNMSRIPLINQVMTSWMEKTPLLVSIGSCQVISNVPSAILLSRFTGDYRSLLLGVNIGGTGTLIASLASLITFREYTAHNSGKAGKYIALFSAFNFAFLFLLTLFSLIFLK